MSPRLPPAASAELRDPSGLARRIYSVAELSAAMGGAVRAQFPTVVVLGEVCNFVRARSGHWYFSLKDEAAQLRAVMFVRSNFSAPQIADGDAVLVVGTPGIYRERGDLQLVVQSVRRAGQGDLQQQFEQLKKELQEQGYFAAERKRSLPFLPKLVALVTSPSGAVLRDMQTIAGRRAAALPLLVVPTAVQGEGAVAGIVAALERAAAHSGVELIVLARGGGGLEDFAAFNSRTVAQAIADCPLPVLCSVGHEADVSIADWVADRRAATPSEAAEIFTAGYYGLPQQLHQGRVRLEQLAVRAVRQKQLHWQQVRGRLQNPAERVAGAMQRIDALEPLLDSQMRRILLQRRARLAGALPGADPAQMVERIQGARRAVRMLAARLAVAGRQNHARLVARLGSLAGTVRESAAVQIRRRIHGGRGAVEAQAGRLRATGERSHGRSAERLVHAAQMLESVSPLQVLGRGYAIARDSGGAVVDSVARLRFWQKIELRLADGRCSARVLRIAKEEEVGG